MTEPLERVTNTQPALAGTALRRKQQPAGGMVALDSPGEARRNRLLRRVDWRFLAGTPHPSRAYVPGGGMLAQALELVAQEVLVSGQVRPGSVDLAALVNPGRTALELAWEALAPGGALYVEWYRPRPDGPAARQRQLAQAGFLPAGAYWPWPWPERATPAFWLPLEAPGALEYFLENRPPVHSSSGRARRAAQTLAWRGLHGLGLLAPVCTIAYKPGAQAPGQLPPTSLPARAAGWGLPEGSGWLLLTGGLHSTNKVTGLVFPPQAEQPASVIKMPRRSVSLPALEREAWVLQAIQSGRARPLAGVPELVFINDAGGHDFPALAETHLPGVPLYTAMQPGETASLAQQATDWLLELVEPGPPQPPGQWWQRLAAPVLDDFARGYAAVGSEALLQAIRPELARLGPLPLAVEHRDFSPWNIFVTPSRGLSVLDWEGAEPRGLPFSDLIYFLAYLAFFAEGALEKGTAPHVYRRLLDPAAPSGAVAAACIQRYCAGAGLPVESLRPLRLLTWMRHAVLERTLIKNSSTGEPEEDLLRRGLYLSLIRAELEENIGDGSRDVY